MTSRLDSMSHFRPAADLDWGRGYPRPQLVRETWMPLNGDWEFALDHDATDRGPRDVLWDRTITVPFAPETPASGIGDTGFYTACWYRRDVRGRRRCADGERLLLHFGAVDYRATVWVNGAACRRARGRLHAVRLRHHRSAGDRRRQQTVVVRADDDPHDLAKPRGKQDWQLEPHSIWYPRTTGIWQTVWMERVPATLDRQPALDARTSNAGRSASRPRLTGRRRERPAPARAAPRRRRRCSPTTPTPSSRASVHRRIALSDPGIDDSRNELLWSPHSPTLIHAELELLGASAASCSIAVQQLHRPARRRRAGRSLPAQRPAVLRCAWCSTRATGRARGLTAPDDAALRRDVELAKAMGFNGVRKHQKIEDPRYLYWADRLGCWSGRRCRAPTASRRRRSQRLTREWTDALRARRQPSVHRRLGADQRVVGRAQPARRADRAPLRARRCIT